MTNALWTTSLSGTLGEETTGKVAGHEPSELRRRFLPEGASGVCRISSGGNRVSSRRGGLHRRRRSERDLLQSRHARRGDRDPLRSRADLLPGPAGVLFPDPRSDDAEPSGQRHRTELRSAIFYLDDRQRRIAEETSVDVDASDRWPRKVVTEVAAAGPFWRPSPSIRTNSTLSERLHLPLRRPDWVLPRRMHASAAGQALTGTLFSLSVGGVSVSRTVGAARAAVGSQSGSSGLRAR